MTQPEFAKRLGKLLDTTPESWLTMQNALDLWRVEQEQLMDMQPIRAA